MCCFGILEKLWILGCPQVDEIVEVEVHTVDCTCAYMFNIFPCWKSMQVKDMQKCKNAKWKDSKVLCGMIWGCFYFSDKKALFRSCSHLWHGACTTKSQEDLTYLHLADQRGWAGSPQAHPAGTSTPGVFEQFFSHLSLGNWWVFVGRFSTSHPKAACLAVSGLWQLHLWTRKSVPRLWAPRWCYRNPVPEIYPYLISIHFPVSFPFFWIAIFFIDFRSNSRSGFPKHWRRGSLKESAVF